MEAEYVPPQYHGENPNGPASGGNYDPQYLVVAHVKSDGWNVHGIHAHFPASGLDPAGRMKLAASLMLAKLDNGQPRFDYPGAPEQPFRKADGSYAQYENFVPFGFGSQHDIYFFLEHAPRELSFTAGDIAQISPRFRNGKPGAANYAFFSTADKTGQVPPELAKRGSLVLMENHFTKKGNSPIDPSSEAFTYKICLLYTAASGIAMVIDPGGTNGGKNIP